MSADALDALVLSLIEQGQRQVDRTRQSYMKTHHGVTPHYLASILRAEHGVTGDVKGAVLASLDRLGERQAIYNHTIGHLGWGWVQPSHLPGLRRITL